MGHPCCNEHECKQPLRKVFDEFCPSHQFLGSLCCIDSCSLPREPGFRTCATSKHRLEEKRRMSLATSGSYRRRPGAVSSRRTYQKDSDNTESSGSARRSSKGVRGVFSRRWTHNEQLMVRPCGIIIGRATFYAAESVSGVHVSLIEHFSHDVIEADLTRLPNRRSSTVFSLAIFQVYSPTFSFSTLHAGYANISRIGLTTTR